MPPGRASGHLGWPRPTLFSIWSDRPDWRLFSQAISIGLQRYTKSFCTKAFWDEHQFRDAV